MTCLPLPTQSNCYLLRMRRIGLTHISTLSLSLFLSTN